MMTFRPLLVLPSLLVVVKAEGGMGVPSFCVMLKTTVGFCPGPVFDTDTICALTPFSCVDLVGTVWAPMTEASHSRVPCGWWQVAHALSSAWGPPGWFRPVVKLTSSWQDWQAARFGNAYQLADWVGGGVLALAAPWQVSQLRMSCGKTTSGTTLAGSPA